jgi:hypothetical protein
VPARIPSVRRQLLGLGTAVSALVVCGTALAVGPWPGLARSVTSTDGVRYVTSRADGATTVRALRGSKVLARTTVDGPFGIPAVTINGRAGGLSPNGRLLVLAEPPNYEGLRARSSFVLLATKPLAVRDTIVLPGEFGFDALSPDGRTLFLLRHGSSTDLNAYEVRAYDLRAGKLLHRVIVAKGESATMRGYPAQRATTKSGAWVYTLYSRQRGAPFIHALNTLRRSAVCIDLPWRDATFSDAFQATFRLSPDERTLVVRSNGRTVATVDTRTFRVG